MPDRCRVAMVTRTTYPLHGYGGLERHVYDLVRFLLRRDVRITLITRTPKDLTLEPSSAARAIVDDDRLDVVFVPYRTFPGAGRRGTTVIDRSTAYPYFGWRAGRVAARLAATGSVDIVHGQGASVFGYATAPAALRQRVPLVFNPHGVEEFGGTGQGFAGKPMKRLAYGPLRSVVRACARRATTVIATDHAIEPTLLRVLPFDRDRMVTIPSAIDVEMCDGFADRADAAAMRATLPNDGSALLVSVGRIEQNKGFDVMARALATLGERPWRWVLVGDGPARQGLEQEVASLGLGERVRMTGRVSSRELWAWYQAADVFVHPTLYEGSSLVTLEAMSRHRAVVATAAGGIPDKIIPGETGWLVPPGNAAALAAAIGDALDHPDQWPRLGANARALVEREFSWEVNADRTLRLYERLLTNSR